MFVCFAFIDSCVSCVEHQLEFKRFFIWHVTGQMSLPLHLHLFHLYSFPEDMRNDTSRGAVRCAELTRCKWTSQQVGGGPNCSKIEPNI